MVVSWWHHGGTSMIFYALLPKLLRSSQAARALPGAGSHVLRQASCFTATPQRRQRHDRVWMACIFWVHGHGSRNPTAIWFGMICLFIYLIRDDLAILRWFCFSLLFLCCLHWHFWTAGWTDSRCKDCIYTFQWRMHVHLQPSFWILQLWWVDRCCLGCHAIRCYAPLLCHSRAMLPRRPAPHDRSECHWVPRWRGCVRMGRPMLATHLQPMSISWSWEKGQDDSVSPTWLGFIEFISHNLFHIFFAIIYLAYCFMITNMIANSMRHRMISPSDHPSCPAVLRLLGPAASREDVGSDREALATAYLSVGIHGAGYEGRAGGQSQGIPGRPGMVESLGQRRVERWKRCQRWKGFSLGVTRSH